MLDLARRRLARVPAAAKLYRRCRAIGHRLVEPRWQGILRQTRDEIATIDASPYYLQTYRQEEVIYWSHIPAWILEDCRKRRVERCLDIGCAYGTLLLYTKKVARCDAYGLDYIEGLISRRLLAQYGIHWQMCDIELQPCPWSGPFDVLILTEVLEHFNFQAVPTLRKIRDLLAPNGRLYLSTPDAAEWGRTKHYVRYEELPPPDPSMLGKTIGEHIWQFSQAELEYVTRRAELKILRLDHAPGAGKRHFNLTLAPA